MTLKPAFRTLTPAPVCLAAKQNRKKPYVFALIAAVFLLFSAGAGVALADGGGTSQYPPPPNSQGVSLWGYGFLPGPAGGCLPSDTSTSCADKYQATLTVSGNQYGTMIAPPPAINCSGSATYCTTAYGVTCTSSLPNICSNGIQQANGVTNIVYDNYPNLCRFVDNNNTTKGTGIFVPQGSAQEFADFVNNSGASIGVTFGYCALGMGNPANTATASFPTGFYITATGGPASAVGGATQLAPVILPTTRVPPAGTTLAPLPPQTAIFAYTRYDCWPGTTPATPSSCNARAIVETQSLLFKVTLPAPPCTNAGSTVGGNCNGGWAPATTVSCTVDGTYYGPANSDSCLADYSPPVVNGACSNPSVKDMCLTGVPVGESYDVATSTWTWTCDGEPGPPTTTDSGPCTFVNAVNGVCNDSLKYSCSAGKVDVASETRVPGPPASYTWICDGLGTGSPSGLPLCTTLASAPGVCGSTRYSCAPGSAVGESDNGITSTWICDGLAGGAPSGPCSSVDIAVGVCNDTSQYSCAPGTAANETDNGTTSTWNCDGIGGGADSGLCSMADPPCAGGPVNGSCNALRYSCAAGTPTSEADNGTTSTWTCSGSCGGTNDTTCSSGDIINGACSSPSVKYSCQAGNVDVPSEIFTPGPPATYTWTCDGINGGIPALGCTSLAIVDGACSSPSVRYTCQTGTAASESDNGTTSKWICDGTGGGTNSGPCTVPDPINGVCGGTADSCTSPAAPSGYVATAGTWTCPGSNGGTNAPCSAGVCGASQYACAAGTAAGKTDNGTTSTWVCDGTNANSGTCSSADPCAAPPECQGITAFPNCAGCVVGSMANCTMGTGANGIGLGEMQWTCTNPNCTPVSCLESE